ncbi:MAG: hypothetical protein A2542_00095 [Parcubacteria group bacterium RIFOXYD2_FULL_52_8]|nr:MAG: hypothetical protein A2542_00095 [Parcubacteria group bacterium RIFOXYD2_FULL_52_8]
MAKQDVINELTARIQAGMSSGDRARIEEAEQLRLLRNAVERGAEYAAPDADVASYPAAEQPLRKKLLEEIKIKKAAQEALAAQQGFLGELNETMKSHEQMSGLDKLGLGATYLLGAAALGTFGGALLPLFGNMAAGANLVGDMIKRFLGVAGTFYTMEALVNNGTQRIFGKNNVPRFVKWGITAASAGTALLFGGAAANFVTHGLTTLVGGVRDWAINWGFFTPEKTPVLDKFFGPSPLPIVESVAIGVQAPEIPHASLIPQVPSPDNAFNYPSDSVMPFASSTPLPEGSKTLGFSKQPSGPPDQIVSTLTKAKETLLGTSEYSSGRSRGTTIV